MDSQKQNATLENRYLPDDVLWNIFMRLPAKLLAQMKSLCKPWNALISHPSFIESHLHHSVHNNPEVLLVFIEKAFSYNEPLKFTAHSTRSPHIQLTDFIKPPLVANIYNESNDTEVIGSVNGLICFSIGSHIHIWNPSLSALIEIPQFPLPDYSDFNDWTQDLRFGFDPKNDDYKVFAATFCVSGRYHDEIVTESLQVNVYSVRKGLWESIIVRFPSHITSICNYSDDVEDGFEGYLHWICWVDAESHEQTLLAFDLGAGTFTEISLPDSIRFGHNFVGVWLQKLCVISNDTDVWVMDTYGVAKSWVKKLHVLDDYRIVPHGFTLSNEFLFELDDDNDVAMYDPSTAAVKLFKIRTGFETKIVRHVDSLVWPFVATPKRATSLQSI